MQGGGYWLFITISSITGSLISLLYLNGLVICELFQQKISYLSLQIQCYWYQLLKVVFYSQNLKKIYCFNISIGLLN